MVNMNDIRGVLPEKPTKFMHQLRAFIRARNLACRTENTYCLLLIAYGLWIMDYGLWIMD